MIQLALETSTRHPSICLLEQARIVSAAPDITSLPTSVSLLPGIEQLLKKANFRPNDLEAISISIGPGSFTGLRLGVSTAKTLAWALGCKVYPVCTHEVIASQARHELRENPDVSVKQIATVIDAQRGQWFAQLHELDSSVETKPTEVSKIVDPRSFLESLNLNTLLCGSGLRRLREEIRLPQRLRVSDEQNWIPCAATVGKLVATHSSRFQPLDPFELIPVYGRKSAAEEKLESSSNGPTAE